MVVQPRTLWGVASLFLTVVQYGPYLTGIIKGRYKPHVFTWFIWAVLTGINFVAQMVSDAGSGSWATGFSALMCATVFVLSARRGEKGIVFIDWATLVCAMLAIVMWRLTNDPLTAVILSSFAGTLGFIPTIRKCMYDPDVESVSSYTACLAKWVCAVFAIQSLTLTTLLSPLMSIINTVAFMLFLLVRRAQLGRISFH